jgi:hypothetical protein
LSFVEGSFAKYPVSTAQLEVAFNQDPSVSAFKHAKVKDESSRIS